MKKHEWWRLCYREHRYLEYVTDVQLLTRLRDILNNLVNITPDGKLGFHEITPVGEAWLVRFTHVLEEYSLRGQDLPYDAMREHQLPDVLTPKRGRLGRDGQSGWAEILPTLPKNAIVKYGKLEFLRPLLEQGKARLCPASFYKDYSLGPHRQDDERIRVTHRHPFGATARLVQRADGTPVKDAREEPILGNITMQLETWDYYVWCASGSLEPRLFIDFDHADACLIIRDVRAFAQRLGWASSNKIVQVMPSVKRIEIEWKGIRYFDPFFPPKSPDHVLPVPWSKPMRFAYQKEFRFVIDVVPPPSETLPIVNIELGPLFDIADIVYIGKLVGHFHYRNPIVRNR